MKEHIKKIDDESFTKATKEGVVLVDFYADWCGPCKTLEPVLHKLAEEMSSKMSFVQIDVDSSPKTTTHFQITSIPTLILFKGGKEVQRVVGLKDLATLKKMVSEAI